VTKPIARSFGGIGTVLFGRRDYRTDGSWITTKYFIFVIPLFPLRSYRVRPIDGGYEILWEGEPVIKQVISLYLWLFSPIIWIFVIKSDIVVLIAIGQYVLLPLVE